MNMSTDHELYELDTKVVLAEHCALTPCLREYQLKTTKGVVKAKVESVNYGVTGYMQPFPVTASWIHATCWQPNRDNFTYYFLNLKSFDYCLNNLDCNFLGNISAPAFCPIHPYIAAIEAYLASTSSMKWTYEYYYGPRAIHKNTSDTIRIIAAHNLSYVLGNVALSLTRLGLKFGGETITGVAYVSETYVSVRWEWLILPVIQVLAGLFLFWVTCVLTSFNQGALWRSSLLPLVYQKFDLQASTDNSVPIIVSEMELKARKAERTQNSKYRRTAVLISSHSRCKQQALIDRNWVSLL